MSNKTKGQRHGPENTTCVGLSGIHEQIASSKHVDEYANFRHHMPENFKQLAKDLCSEIVRKQVEMGYYSDSVIKKDGSVVSFILDGVIGDLKNFYLNDMKKKQERIEAHTAENKDSAA